MVPKQMKLIYIQGMDACSKENKGSTKEELCEGAKEYNYIIEQVGGIMEETPTYVLLAGNHSIAQKGEIEFYNQTIKIPKTGILKKIDLTKYITKKKK